jgi:hypothetical protein
MLALGGLTVRWLIIEVATMDRHVAKSEWPFGPLAHSGNLTHRPTGIRHN